MAKTPPGSGDDDKEIADAAFLFQDEAPKKSRPPSSPPTAPKPSKGVESGYDLAGDEPEAEGSEPIPPVPAAPARPVVKSPKVPQAPRSDTVSIVPQNPARPAAKTPKEKPAPAVEARVDETWSRGKEWGGTLGLMFLVLVMTVGLVYLTFGPDRLGLTALIVLVGVGILALLCYPLLITLERPVRMTPEQAVKDFYTALSHQFPHYRRMWLLLSSEGRVSPWFDSYSSFKAYWKQKLAQLKKGKNVGGSSLIFEVANFKSAEKSAGKTSLDAKYTIQVVARGKQAQGPLESVRIEGGFVRGPDRMWYLNQGAFPEPKPTAKPAGMSDWPEEPA